MELVTDPAVLINSIYKCPLPVFIECAADGNLQGLVISGEASEADIKECWNDIVHQFVDTIGAIGNQRRKQMIKQLVKARTSLFLINESVKILDRYYVKYFADKLNYLLTVRYKWDPVNKEEYDKDLKSCLTRSKQYKMEAALLEMQLDAMDKSEKKEEFSLSRKFFDDALISLSDSAGYALNEENLSAYQFAERIRRLNNSMSNLSPQPKKKV